MSNSTRTSAAKPEKPVLIYDSEFNFIHPVDRQDVKDYSTAIYAALQLAERKAIKARDETLAWLSIAEIKRQTGGEARVRLWSDAISLLVDRIETKDGAMTKYRVHAMREMPTRQWVRNSY